LSEPVLLSMRGVVAAATAAGREHQRAGGATEHAQRAATAQARQVQEIGSVGMAAARLF
jgi:hypothetical protein